MKYSNKLVFILLATSFFGGCSTLELEREETFTGLMQSRGIPPQSEPASISNRILSLADVQHLALNNHPTIKQAEIALSIGELELKRDQSLSNPILSGLRQTTDETGQGPKIALSLVTSLTDLITLPYRQNLARQEFRALQLDVAHQVTSNLLHAQHHYFKLVLSEHLCRIAESRLELYTTKLELAERFHAAGNLEPTEYSIHQVDAAQAEIDLAEKRHQLAQARYELSALLGVDTHGSWGVPGGIPMPIALDNATQELVAIAQENRLDYMRDALELVLSQTKLRNSGWRRWIGDIEIGFERERETDGAILKGPSLDVEIPVFRNREQKDLASLSSELAQLALDAKALDIKNSLHTTVVQLRAKEAALSTFREKLLPGLGDLTAHTQAEYNFMLTGVFEVLNQKAAEFEAQASLIDLLQSYWDTRIGLIAITGTSLPTEIDWVESNSFYSVATAIPDHSHHTH